MSILIIEDSPDDEALVLRALEKAGVTNPITIVRDGAEALEYIFATGKYEGAEIAHPIITLLDLDLPKVDGLEVLRRIRADPRTAHNPVVILTLSDDYKNLAESYGLGVNSYVRKPVDFVEFSKIITTLGLYWTLTSGPVYKG